MYPHRLPICKHEWKDCLVFLREYLTENEAPVWVFPITMRYVYVCSIRAQPQWPCRLEEGRWPHVTVEWKGGGGVGWCRRPVLLDQRGGVSEEAARQNSQMRGDRRESTWWQWHTPLPSTLLPPCHTQHSTVWCLTPSQPTAPYLAQKPYPYFRVPLSWHHLASLKPLGGIIICAKLHPVDLVVRSEEHTSELQSR